MADTFGELLGVEIFERREAAGMTRRELAEQSFPELDGEDGKLEGKESRIKELETGKVTRPQAKNYTPICETLSITRADIHAMKAQAADAQAQEEAEFSEAFPGNENVEDAIENPGALSRDALELLAGRFEIPDAHLASDTDLRKLLTLKAQEYRALRAEVDGISEGLKRLSNLKAAAQDAIARVDLEEVEEILSRVQEVEKEEAAKTAELRADNALLRGRVDQAAALLADAADSFRIIDPLEPARRRILGYFPILKNHGLRYGGAGLMLSRALLSPVLTEDLKTKDAWLWAAGQNSLAIALRNQGIRTAGPEGADLLAQSVTATRAALEVRTRADHPVDWAMTQVDLGTALADQATRTAGPEGADLLAQAVTAYRTALEVHTRADHPVDWAMTQMNLGNALADQGIRTAGPEGADLLSQAVTAFRAALEVRTRDDQPVDWARTQVNLAATLRDRATHDTTPVPAPHLAEALAAVDMALEVFDPDHMSYEHNNATRLRDAILADLAALDEPPA